MLLGLRYLAHGAAGAQPAGASREGGPEIRVQRAGGGRVVVHVAGAVRRPGVYRLAGGERVADAVKRAGGATRRADLGGVNLAAKLEDGRQIIVPRRGTAATGGPASPGTSGSAASAAASASPVNLNTATPEQLDTLPGVGPATVQKIVEYREQHGGFGSVEELGQVSGIGDKRLAALRDHVRV